MNTPEDRKAIYSRNPLRDRDLIFEKLQPGDEIALTFKRRTFRAAVVGHVVKRTRKDITVNNGCCPHTYRLGEIQEINVIEGNGNDHN